MKAKTVFFCTECGSESPRWSGRCTVCGAWNSMVEQAAERPSKNSKMSRVKASVKVSRITDMQADEEIRFSTGMGELDRVLGGGAVKGSLVLVGGAPGIGKSTLMLQICQQLGKFAKVLYVSGEESTRQLKLRAERLRVDSENLFVLSETRLGDVLECVQQEQPDILIVDSIQTLYNEELDAPAGGVGQVKDCTMALMQLAKGQGVTVFVIGHVNKEGSIAGPKVLEHMVDCVLYFEGDRQNQYRILRAVKNRFGSINEIGIFEMRRLGMVEVPNPSEMLLSQRAHGQSGSVVLCALEGTRPVLVDVQALVAPTAIGYPRRMASGVEQGRLALLLAVLEKRAGLPMYNQDVYINIAGGLTLDEPACDLALMVAVASAARNIPVDETFAVMGEVGLAGEVRAVSQVQRRVGECARLGFKNVLLPRSCMRGLKLPEGVRAWGVETIGEALRTALVMPASNADKPTHTAAE